MISSMLLKPSSESVVLSGNSLLGKSICLGITSLEVNVSSIQDKTLASWALISFSIADHD